MPIRRKLRRFSEDLSWTGAYIVPVWKRYTFLLDRVPLADVVLQNESHELSKYFPIASSACSALAYFVSQSGNNVWQ